jgi:hypothetical protein
MLVPIAGDTERGERMSTLPVQRARQNGNCPWHARESSVAERAMPVQPAPLVLAPEQRVPGRPFTDPVQSSQDMELLEAMRATLGQLLVHSERLPERPPPLLLYPSTTNGLRQRVILLDPARLTDDTELTAVGFFGQLGATADRPLLEALDLELIAEFLRYPLLLSYSSHELADGNWANLVLLGHPEGLDHWSGGAKHAYVAAKVAPTAYASIRLHTAVLPRGVLGPRTLCLRRTKYYDFADKPAWRAVREL